MYEYTWQMTIIYHYLPVKRLLIKQYNNTLGLQLVITSDVLTVHCNSILTSCVRYFYSS